MRLNGMLRMMCITCLIFFKYRIVNKMVVIITIKDEDRLGLFGCFLIASEFLQVLFGILILKFLKGRRYMLQAILLIV